uniref:Uncharacterized protein n=1 Tax=Meloidogyne enterolobii TaxID=390850 RepID=A0A6V7VYB8_MELEN|nr:unnamed protein product [Meloidogyne enterolobii]
MADYPAGSELDIKSSLIYWKETFSSTTHQIFEHSNFTINK